MSNIESTKATMYNDFHGLNQLRADVASQKKSGVSEVAQQFEALFLQSMLKNFRESNDLLAEGLFDSKDMDMYYEMFEKQVALMMAKKGVGFADSLARQLEQMQPGSQPRAAEIKVTAEQKPLAFTMKDFSNKVNQAVHSIKTVSEKTFASPTEFVTKLWQVVKPIATKLGLDPKVMIAQAALETGWGKKIIKNSDGSLSHNLFGIKAHRDWHNKIAVVNTLEYRDGIAAKEKANFRSYHSFSDSVSDYAEFLQNNPRYQVALTKASDPEQFVQALQQAGYATDPKYANKIMSIYKSDVFKSLQ